MKKFSTILLIALFALNIFGQTMKSSSSGIVLNDRARSETSLIVSDEEYEVYAAALRYAMSRNDDEGIPIIKVKTGIDKQSKQINYLADEGLFEKIKPETMPDFLIKNEEASTLEGKFPDGMNHIFVTDEQLAKDFGYEFDGGMSWELFQEKYSKNASIYTLSRVGFSKDKNEALIFVTFWCDRLCGQGNYYIMKKENGKWKIADSMMTWIS